MTYRLAAFLVIPVLLGAFVPMPARAADLELRVANITMVPLPPTCEVRATKRVIRSGGSVDIVWKSRNAETVTGMVKGDKEWATKGRQRISIAVLGKHEFPMTFTSKSGATSTCTAKVFVHAKK